MKKVLGFLLGAGSGMIGTFIRTGLATLGGVLVAKGWLDAGTATVWSTAIAGAAISALAAIGSYLNNSAE